MTICAKCGKPIDGDRMVIHPDTPPTWNAEGVYVGGGETFEPFHERCFDTSKPLNTISIVIQRL